MTQNIAKSDNPQGSFDNLSTKGPAFLEIKDSLGQTLNLKSSQALIVHTNHQNSIYGPFSLNTTAISNGQSMDIKIDRSLIGDCVGATLELTINNPNAYDGGNSSGKISMLPVALWINYIEILLNNGKSSLMKTYGEHLWLSQVMLSDEQLSHYNRVANQNECWAPLTWINPQTSRTFYLHLHDSIFKQCKLNIRGMKGDLIFRIFFNPWSKIQETMTLGGTLAPTIQACNMYLHILTAPEQETRAVENVMMNSMVGADFLFLQPGYLKDTQVMNAGNKITVKLQGLVGKVSHMFIMIRPSNPVGRQVRTSQPVQSIELCKSNGQNIMGGQPIGDKFIRFIEWPGLYPSKLMCHSSIYFITHAADVVSLFQGGGMTGYYEYDGNQQLNLYLPPATQAVNEVQTISSVNGLSTSHTNATGGSYYLRFRGYTSTGSGGFTYNASPQTVQRYLEQIPSIGVGNVVVGGQPTGLAAGPLTFTFVNDLGAQPLYAEGSPIELVSAGDLNAGGTTPLIGRTALTNQGVYPDNTNDSDSIGWTNGTYDVEIYYYIYSLLKVKYGEAYVCNL